MNAPNFFLKYFLKPFLHARLLSDYFLANDVEYLINYLLGFERALHQNFSETFK